MNITSDLMGSYINFSVYPSELFGTGFQNVLVKSILDWQDANNYIDAATVHAQVFPDLPGGTPNNYQAYPYVKLQMPTGDVVVLGLPWINASTVVVAGAQAFNINVPNCTAADIAKLTNALLANGYTGFTITPANT